MVEIPFAEGAPPDNLQVEEVGDDVLIGDPALDEVSDIDTGFDDNLAEKIDEKELSTKASSLLGYYNDDRAARSEWEERYKKGLKTLDPDGGLEESDEERATRGLSTVVHPLIAEAATQFNARAIAELYPSGGPVKTVIIGTPNEETEDQARRVREFMNYQIVEEMPEYFPDLDQMLFHLPLVGQTFKKVWWDTNLGRQCSQFVRAEDFIVAPESKDLQTSPRYTHIIRMPRNDFNKYVKAGWYMPTDFVGESMDPAGQTVGEIEGVDTDSEDAQDEIMTLLEMHVYELFDGIDEEDPEDDNAVAVPYVVTIEESTQNVVGIRRNYKEDDNLKKRLEYFVHYVLIEGLGAYGLGFVHLIGGLSKS